MRRLLQIPFGLVLVIVFATGCCSVRTPAPKGAVVKIITQGGNYNILINDEGKISTTIISAYNVTFVEDVRANEKMWIENDPDHQYKFFVHIHNMKDIKTAATEGDE